MAIARPPYGDFTKLRTCGGLLAAARFPWEHITEFDLMNSAIAAHFVTTTTAAHKTVQLLNNHIYKP